MCVHLDGLNAEHKFRVWDTILGHTRPFLSTSLCFTEVDTHTHSKCYLEDMFCFVVLVLFGAGLNYFALVV